MPTSPIYLWITVVSVDFVNQIQGNVCTKIAS